MKKKQALKIINENYWKIKEILSSVHHGRYHEEYYNLIQQEERGHRKWRHFLSRCGLTINEAVNLFYVQTIFEYLYNNRTLSARDYINVRKSHFFACSLVENYKEELIKVLQGVNIEEINKIDYAKLMQ
jgi:hypothetical protein